MSRSNTEKALRSLKERVDNAKTSINWAREHLYKYSLKETEKVIDEIDTLIQAYERQIELNKKQNLKIKHQKGILKVLQQKAR